MSVESILNQQGYHYTAGLDRSYAVGKLYKMTNFSKPVPFYNRLQDGFISASPLPILERVPGPDFTGAQSEKFGVKAVLNLLPSILRGFLGGGGITVTANLASWAKVVAFSYEETKVEYFAEGEITRYLQPLQLPNPTDEIFKHLLEDDDIVILEAVIKCNSFKLAIEHDINVSVGLEVGNLNNANPLFNIGLNINSASNATLTFNGPNPIVIAVRPGRLNVKNGELKSIDALHNNQFGIHN